MKFLVISSKWSLAVGLLSVGIYAACYLRGSGEDGVMSLDREDKNVKTIDSELIPEDVRTLILIC
jgi:hypothetical protein